MLRVRGWWDGYNCPTPPVKALLDSGRIGSDVPPLGGTSCFQVQQLTQRGVDQPGPSTFRPGPLHGVEDSNRMGSVVAALIAGALVCGVIGWFVGKAPWTSEGGARGFALGLLLGPIGVLIAAVLRAGESGRERTQAPQGQRGSAPSMSHRDLVARGLAPLPKSSAPAKAQTTGMLSVVAQDLQSSDELIRDGRFLPIRSVEVADKQVSVVLESGESVALPVDDAVKIHRSSSPPTQEGS